MADFSTEAELSIVVPRRELRSARQEVEDALAEVPVGMSASGGAGGGGTNAAREQRRRRREGLGQDHYVLHALVSRLSVARQLKQEACQPLHAPVKRPCRSGQVIENNW